MALKLQYPILFQDRVPQNATLEVGIYKCSLRRRYKYWQMSHVARLTWQMIPMVANRRSSVISGKLDPNPQTVNITTACYIIHAACYLEHLQYLLLSSW